MMSSGKKRSLKVGDLISTDDTLGLVLGKGHISPVIRGVSTMRIWWFDEDKPTEIDVIAYEKGWVRLVSSVDVPTV